LDIDPHALDRLIHINVFPLLEPNIEVFRLGYLL